MKEKWKYDRQWLIVNAQGVLYFSLIVLSLMIIPSCKNISEPEHLSTATGDLNGLEQPANQTVFSEVKTILPVQKSISPLIEATGVIAYDPSLLNNISARFDGRIEKLYVRYNFEIVYKGQRIMDVYSPEILTEQQNLIFLLNNPSPDQLLIKSSKQKLIVLGVTNEQLRQIEILRKLINPMPVYSPYSGHIHDIGLSNGVKNSLPSMGNGMSSGNRNLSNSSTQGQIENIPSSQTSSLSIREGMYIDRGQPIFAVYNTNKIWAVLNIFPLDAKCIKVGDKVSLISETNPTNTINAVIGYIEPVTGQNASAIKARVYLENEVKPNLKIGTLVNAKINSNEISGIWVPRKAVLNIGQKQIVFIKTKVAFQTKKIRTGVVADSFIQIIQGLNIEDQIAVNAQYMVDSESFIIAKEDE